RSKHSLSQFQLAHKAGLTVTAIANYEQGRAKPSYEVLIKIADALGVSLDELVGRKFPKKK
ncbi:MAG: helix-turn-helix transcriptional regulator, partial [Candidatus Margulisbacteria bacterium]|nr:helix-turn-helix transcriptional regulator [Candidatus Margulisiibacteriota bacterium]